MAELDALFEQARLAGPVDRIDFRVPIAAHGADAIPTLRDWLYDERLSRFSVRTLERIARDPAHRRAVVAALEAVDPLAVSPAIAEDITGGLVRIRLSAGTSQATDSTSRRPTNQWPGTRQVSTLELAFHDDMLLIFRLAGEATRHVRSDGSIERGYWASYFLRAVRSHGGLAYAKDLLSREGTTDGFQRLTAEGRLDLTMEALVLKAEYTELFTDNERRVAADRLARAGYQPGAR